MYKVMNSLDELHVYNRGGIYHFVRRIPADLRQFYSASRISFSLKTKSLTTCYPVHAKTEEFLGAMTNDIWKSGEILVSGVTEDRLIAVIMYKKKIYHCFTRANGRPFSNSCFLHSD